MSFYDLQRKRFANDLDLDEDQVLELKRLGVLDRDTACKLLGIPPDQIRGQSRRKQLHSSIRRREENSDW
jgi:hypothetical protein